MPKLETDSTSIGNYFDYVRAIRATPVTKAVKLADLTHNSDETRFAGCPNVTEAQLARWREKYATARAILENDNSGGSMDEDS